MPTPSAPPPPKTRELPANLDELVRRAMTGGGIQALKVALAEPTTEPVSPLAPPPKPPLPPASAPPDSPPKAEPERENASSEPTPDPLDALAAAANDALAARAQPEALRAALARLRAALPAADALAADAHAVATPEVSGTEADDGPPIRLPPARHRWALALARIPSGAEVGVLAGALEVDLATTRAAVLAGGTRIVLRAPERLDLDRRAAAVTALGVRARVLERAELLAFGPARALVAADTADVWRVAELPRWGETRPDPSQLPRGLPHNPGTVWLIVPGEVEEKRPRPPAAESRWQRTHYAAANGAGGECRIAVLDLHTDEGVFRVVEGAIDLRSLAGADTAAQRQSIKAFTEALTARWPEAEVQPRRMCTAQPRPGDSRILDGWSTWEEHSRVCRLLLAADQSRT